MTEAYRGIIRRYRHYLPIDDKHIVTLNEGNTPLMECKRLREHLNCPARILLKFEGINPTCSFKDRGMTYAISKACEEGAKAVICASTGNTSAAAAAYAARAGIKAVVLIPKGNIAYGKLSQALQYGAKVIQIDGNFDQCLQAVIKIGESYPVKIVNSVNPNRLLGQMTAAFEIVDHLQKAPDYHFIPVGNAGNISAYWMGYKQYHQDNKSPNLPKMMGFQAEGASPIVQGKVIENPETIATAIRIGNPACWKKAEAARDESKGVIESVTDDEILHAYDLLAQYSGYFCEPASAASVAGLIKLKSKLNLQKDQTIVCTLTGHGLKDPDVAIKRTDKPVTCSANVEEIVKQMGL
ncbi:threonine synthase [bacterium K02(2017)]|nr:threonine synthase [bacterium K02(2017)]